MFLVGVAALAAACAPIKPPSPPVPPPAGQPATFADLWAGTTHWTVKQDTATSPLSNGAGLHIVPTGGVWHAFYRLDIPIIAGCSSSFVVVTADSTDQGATWNTPVVVASPQEGTASRCGVTDGSAVFDGTGWWFITQCQDDTWHLCSYRRAGADPHGAFAPVAVPLFGGDPAYLSHLTGTPGGGDGTPDVFQSAGGWFYVSFHATATDYRQSWRGVARTTDFAQTWQPVVSGAMLSSTDCQAWQADCIGPGVSSILTEGGYNYQLVESTNLTLQCDPSQTWMNAVVRAPNLAQTGGWTAAPGNPIETGAGSCTLNYSTMFRASGAVYLAYVYNRGAASGFNFVLRRLEK
jgi:hypothetical protein